MIKNISYCAEFGYFCSMNRLKQLGNIPVTFDVLASLYPEIVGKNQKIGELERTNKIIRLKRGMYVLDPSISERLLCKELIANHLYGPSYVSMHSALRYYGLIPEAVYTMQSMTTKRARRFENSLGLFEYTYCPREYFSIGISTETCEAYSFVIARPEKALCDTIVYTSGLNLRYKGEVLSYLEEDLRLDMEAFAQMDVEIFRQCASVGRKQRTLDTIIKILEL